MRRKTEKAYFDREYKFGTTVKRLSVYAAEQRGWLIVMFLLLLISAAISIAVPLVVREGLNELSKSSGAIDYEMLKIIGWIYFVGSFFEWLINYAQIKVNWIITARSISSLRIQMFSRLQDMDVGFFDKMETGKVMNRVMDDSNQAGNLINVFATFFSSLTLIVVMLGIMFSVNGTMTWWILGSIPVIVVVVIFIANFLRKYSQKVRRTRAAVNAAVQQTITGVAVSKGFNREKQNSEEFTDLNRENLNASLKLSYTFSIFFPLIDFFSVLILYLILNSGGLQVIQGNIRIGDLYLFYSYTLRLFGPVIQLASQVARIQAGSAATERIFSLLDLDSVMKVGSDKPESVEGHVTFDNVHFAYTPDVPVYQGLSVDIHPKQTIALVGHTGAGKTTMVSLLARFYEIQEGQILIDHKNVQSFDIESYRSHLGIVPQEPYLFAGTIADNIRYAKPDATDEEILEVIRLTHLDEFVDSLPEGIDTDVRERGSRLSTGQRQLITLARALLANPAILILDEATASVDAYTESMIQKSLENLFADRTSIVVAHRLSTIIHADRILVFDQGQIVGDGSHDALIETNDTYRDLYKTYYEFQGIETVAD
jgi:ABC-type multidrug transport system fused ATPase/permease subunit